MNIKTQLLHLEPNCTDVKIQRLVKHKISLQNKKNGPKKCLMSKQEVRNSAGVSVDYLFDEIQSQEQEILDLKNKIETQDAIIAKQSKDLAAASVQHAQYASLLEKKNVALANCAIGLAQKDAILEQKDAVIASKETDVVRHRMTSIASTR